LETNSKQYSNLYTDGISKNELARRIIDQRNINDKKDYFNDTNKDQIKKANSYAEYILGDQVSILEKEQKEHTEEITKETAEAEVEKNEQVDELKNKLNGEDNKPKEEVKESSETQVETIKERIKKTIDRYIDKVKQLKNSNEEEKKKINTEMDELQKELKKAKEEYETAKNVFMGKINYDGANLPKISTRWIRFGKKTVKG
jgi:chromosome segregation ATPase